MPSEIAIDPALRAAGFIGVWSTDVPASLSVLDTGAAELLAGDVSLAGQPLPLETALRQTHPVDRDWVFSRIRRARQTGGPISAEFRVLTAGGDVRWVLNRGFLAPDGAGTMRGKGAYLDTTDSHQGPFFQGHPTELPEADPLIAAADLSLEAHSAILRTRHKRLRQLSEYVLSEIGYALARRMGADGS